LAANVQSPQPSPQLSSMRPRAHRSATAQVPLSCRQELREAERLVVGLQDCSGSKDAALAVAR
jgi:hypothetical protein